MANQIRQNDKIKEMAEHGVFTRKEVDAALTAPVFEWHGHDAFDDKQYEYLQQTIGLSPERLPFWGPFPVWRISLKQGFLQIHHDKPHKKWRVTRMKLDASLPPPMEYWIDLLSGENYMPFPERIKFFVNGQDLSPRATDDLVKRVHTPLLDMGRETWKILGTFIANVALPGTVVLRVGPENAVTKSVTWRASRTHYLILNHRQAKACLNAKRGPTPGEMVRAAHWRRAHFRRLSSDVFKKKKGFYVPVKHAWVGPKEWTGSDKKIYKVVDLAPKEPPADSTPSAKSP